VIDPKSRRIYNIKSQYTPNQSLWRWAGEAGVGKKVGLFGDVRDENGRRGCGMGRTQKFNF
jgi:hypothetical protein